MLFVLLAVLRQVEGKDGVGRCRLRRRGLPYEISKPILRSEGEALKRQQVKEKKIERPEQCYQIALRESLDLQAFCCSMRPALAEALAIVQ